ncbi:MAG TPA: LysR substrate-binding domain-containing protein, partial [Burkholderiales bacterium]|nr:LysR substrate-binding domain-containing protein [Burkholderiales bacterium]
SLIKYTFLVREAGSGTRIAMERFLSGHGLRIHSEVEMSSNEAIKEGVQAGLGLAIVSMHTILLELETHRLEVLDVENMPIKRNWYVVHRKEKRLSQLAQTFSDFLISDASQYVFHPVRTS